MADPVISATVEHTPADNQIVEEVLRISQEPTAVREISSEEAVITTRPRLEPALPLSVEIEVPRSSESAHVTGEPRRDEPLVISIDPVAAKTAKQIGDASETKSPQSIKFVKPNQDAPLSLAVKPIEAGTLTVRENSLANEATPDRIEAFSNVNVSPEDVPFTDNDTISLMEVEVPAETEPFDEPHTDTLPVFDRLDDVRESNLFLAEVMGDEPREPTSFEASAEYRPPNFEDQIVALLPSLEPAQAETAQELVHDLVLMIRESSQLPEAAGEERQIIEQVIEELSGQLLACYGETCDKDIIQQFIEDIRESTKAPITSEVDSRPNIESLNYRGTHEYKSTKDVSLASRLAHFIGHKLQPQLALGRYTLHACLP